MEIVAISQCLIGDKVRYDGKGKYNPLVKEILQKYDLLPICPEVLGGLPIPRLKSEIKKDKVINEEEKDVTKNFKEGATKAFKLLEYNHVKLAILQDRSPSCGVHQIHDGSFKNHLINGEGITTRLLKEKGIECYTIEEFYEKFIKNK